MLVNEVIEFGLEEQAASEFALGLFAIHEALLVEGWNGCGGGCCWRG